MKEHAAAESARYMARVVDHVPAMLAYWDADLSCRFANAAYAQWFGVDPAGLIGTTMRELLGPDLFAKTEPYILGALAGAPQFFERLTTGRDGVARHAVANYLPDVRDGVVVGLITHVAEVTPLKRTQEKLQEAISRLEAEAALRRSAEAGLIDSQHSLAVTLASIDAGFLATDREGRVTTMNAVAERVTGWSAAEARGHSLWEVCEREGRPRELLEMNPVDAMIAQGITIDMAFRVVMLSRTGARTPMEVKADVTHADDGTPRGMLLLMRDLSRQNQAEVVASRLAAIVESSSDAIIGKTLDGRITDWNRGAQALLGYSAEEAIGQPVQMLFPPDREAEEMRILAELARGQTVPAFDTVRRAKDGSLREVSISVSPIRDAAGRIIGASKIARDVSQQRLAEQARLTALRLEAENRQILEASRLKSLFLANMSHELRTPLNAIIGFADLLHSGAVRPESPKHHDFLGHIATSGRHLLQLINDVLDLSKVEAGKFEFHAEPLDLVALVKDVCDVLHPAALAKRLRVDVVVDDSLTDIVLDPARLKQALYNYLSNAIKFSAPGRRVSVRALPEGPTHFRIEVEDRGIGIAAVDLPRLFSEFLQLDSGSTKRHQGTGLGLALTRRLVQAQGGSVGVASEPGMGSTFHLVLNRVHGHDARVAAAALEPRSQRLLVIEDDTPLQTRMAAALAQAGYGVDAASTGDEALRHAFGQAYDGITLDLVLPDRRGLALLASIRGHGPSRASPVLGLSMPVAAGSSASFSIANVLGKPIRTEEVAAAMAHLRRGQAPRASVMVVDDDMLAREVMRSTLEDIGLDVVCVEGGRQALAELGLHRPDAMVLDLMMPDFDGFAVLAALREQADWRDLPVYIWTSMLLSDAEYDELAHSARAVLNKGGGLLESVLEALQRWRPPQTVPLTGA